MSALSVSASLISQKGILSAVSDFADVCLNDFDRLDVNFNNLINEVIQYEQSKKKRHPVIRRYGHAFLLWKMLIQFLIPEFIEENPCLLTEVELRRLHRRFGHLSARRLYEILERFDHEVEFRAIEHLIKYCHHCQMHEKSFDRFTFSIRNEDIQFNYNILMNILYIEIKIGNENKFVFHIVNETIRFQIERWLRNISTRHV